MNTPARHDEITEALGYIDAQLEALRSAAYGLTDEQARETPLRSALSIGGLVKHAGYVMSETAEWLADEGYERSFDRAGFEKFTSSFAVAADTTVEQALAEFDDLRAALLEALAAVDPDADRMEPIAPWDGRMEPAPIKMRYRLVHLVEEFARHAGHADIIREQIDGQSVPALVKSLAGQPSNDFFTAYEPAPGTLLA